MILNVVTRNVRVTIDVGGPVVERLRAYGQPGASLEEVITGLMDEVDRGEFVAETRRRLRNLRREDLVDLRDIG